MDQSWISERTIDTRVGHSNAQHLARAESDRFGPMTECIHYVRWVRRSVAIVTTRFVMSTNVMSTARHCCSLDATEFTVIAYTKLASVAFYIAYETYDLSL